MECEFKFPSGVNERFDKDAFDNSIGKLFKLKMGDISEEVILIGADVSENGEEVLFTLDLPDTMVDKLLGNRYENSSFISVEAEIEGE